MPCNKSKISESLIAKEAEQNITVSYIVMLMDYSIHTVFKGMWFYVIEKNSIFDWS